MARKKITFRPDPTGSGILNKLYITKRQRRTMLRWALYSGACIGVLVVQDVILTRLKLFGGTIDLAPLAVLLVCVLEGAESGSVFALLASLFYAYSGSAPGVTTVGVLTAICVLTAVFRQNFLQPGFNSSWLSCAVGGVIYQLTTFGLGLFMGQTHLGRLSVFLMNAVLGALALPAVYPAFHAIAKNGEDTWKE